MTIHSVDMTKALNNEAYAAQVIRSGKCSASERGQLAAQWGSDKIAKWESVDSTKYEITDDVKADARSKGAKKAEDAARTDKDGNVSDFDGKSDGTESAVGATANVAGAAGGVLASIASVSGFLTKNKSATLAAISGGVLLASAIMLKSLNPNQEQADACDNLQETMNESQADLEFQQDILSDTTNQITEKTDDLTKASEDANKATETKQKDYEKLQARYQELVDKATAASSGGEPLTEADKAELQQLGATLGQAYEDLTSIKVEGDENIETAKEEVGEAQEIYDDAAVKMEEVQEITEYQAEFDEATVDNADMVKKTSEIGVLGAAGTVLAGVLGWGKSIFHPDFWAAPVAVAEGVASGVLFGGIIKDQGDYGSRAQAGVDTRHATEDINTATNDVYEEELDNYAGNIDLMDEIELTETTASETNIVELPSATPPEDNTGDAQAAQAPADNEPEVNPFAPPSNKAEDKSGGVGDDDSNPFGGKVDKDKEL